MQLKKKRLRITEASGRGDLGAVASGPQATQQTGFSAALKGGVEGQAAGALELLAKTTTREQQGHRGSAGWLSLAGKRRKRGEQTHALWWVAVL